MADRIRIQWPLPDAPRSAAPKDDINAGDVVQGLRLADGDARTAPRLERQPRRLRRLPEEGERVPLLRPKEATRRTADAPRTGRPVTAPGNALQKAAMRCAASMRCKAAARGECLAARVTRRGDG